jgi:hypothetical protein
MSRVAVVVLIETDDRRLTAPPPLSPRGRAAVRSAVDAVMPLPGDSAVVAVMPETDAAVMLLADHMMRTVMAQDEAPPRHRRH